MTRSVSGLHRAIGGFRKRERECLDGTLDCKIRGCREPSIGYIASWYGADPICEVHALQGESLGYVVHRIGEQDEQ